MTPVHDYLYRFPPVPLNIPGRCRVRIYRRKNGTHTVLLTELNYRIAEGIASACERIATDLTASKGLNPKTTRWIQHDPPHDDMPQVFNEVRFTWDSDNTASDPQWQGLDDKQTEVLTGQSLTVLALSIGELDAQPVVGMEQDEETETKRTA